MKLFSFSFSFFPNEDLQARYLRRVLEHRILQFSFTYAIRRLALWDHPSIAYSLVLVNTNFFVSLAGCIFAKAEKNYSCNEYSLPTLVGRLLSPT